VVGALLTVLTAALAPAAHADIYTCTDEHGNVASLQTPCPVPNAEKAAANDDGDSQPIEAEQDEYVPESTPEPRSPAAPLPSSRRAGETLRECKKRYRDQIDEIDAEMRKGFSREEGATFKERLLALTSQLRACAAEPSGTR
jgi:hypothetical protein